MKMHLRWTALALLVLLTSTALPCAAQDTKNTENPDAQVKEELDDGLKWLAVPTLKYNDDAGFQYGVALNMVEKRKDALPHVWDLRLRLEHSTRGRHTHRILLDAPHFLGHGLRFYFQANVLHIQDANYFGVGNDSFKDTTQDRHKFTLTEPRLCSFLAKEIFPDLNVGAGVEYSYSRLRAPQNSLLERDAPLGSDGNQSLQLVVRIQFDNRRSIIRPKNSYLGQAYLKAASEALGSTYTYGTFGTSHQGYLAPLPWLVFAQRVVFEHQVGDVPLSELYRLGGAVSVRGIGGVHSQRGFLEGRFLGRTRALSNSEIRAYLPSAWGIESGVGLFMDNSRVSGPGAFWEDIHSSGGAEIVLGWKDAFLFRMDYAISNEDRLFYISGRHLF